MANWVTADSVGGARGLEGQRDTGSELVGLDCATSHAIELLVARYCGLASLDVHGYIIRYKEVYAASCGPSSTFVPTASSPKSSLRLVSLD